MTVQQLKVTISDFRGSVENYRDLLVKSRDDVIPRITRNREEIERMRKVLNGQYGRLHEYLKKLGKRPVLGEPATGNGYEAYGTAFSGDNLLMRVGPSINAVLQDLDYIAGRLDRMTEAELAAICYPREREAAAREETRNYWELTNPAWWAYEIARWLWQHKFASAVVTVLGLLAIDYSLAWQNVVCIWGFLSKLFGGGR